MSEKTSWFLYIAVASVNLITLLSGVAYAWTSPTLLKLKNPDNFEDNPFGRVITPFEESWLVSIISVGASLGPFLGLIFVDRIGRKKTLLVLSFPMVVSHLTLAFSNDINLFYTSRFLIGIACGCIYSIVPIYVGEVAEDNNRGSLGCVLSIIATVGTLFCYVVGPYLTIQKFCLILVVPAIVFLVVFGLFIPETPYYLLMTQRPEEAEASLKKLRAVYNEREFMEIRKNVELSGMTDFKFIDCLKNKAIQKGLLLGSGLMFFQQCSGITVIISYMQPIFKASGAAIQPEIAAIIVGGVQLVANLATTQLVDRLGRRILLLGSLIGGVISHFLLGLYFYLKINNYDDVVSYLSWLPISSVVLYVVLYMSGLGPVTWAMIGELFPTHFRSYASAFLSFICLFIAFVLTLFFPNLREVIGMAFSFWIFAVSCAFGLVFVWIMVPETKGKSLYEIQLILEGDYKP